MRTALPASWNSGVPRMPHQCLQDPDIHALIARMETRIDPDLQPITALPCRLEATLAGGETHVIDRPATPGNPSLPLSWNEVEEKFRRCASATLDNAAQAKVIDIVSRIEDFASSRTLLRSLVPA